MPTDYENHTTTPRTAPLCDECRDDDANGNTFGFGFRFGDARKPDQKCTRCGLGHAGEKPTTEQK